MKYTYNPENPPFSRLTSVEVNGNPIDPEASYAVTANEFALMFLGYLNIIPDNLYLYEDSTEFQVISEFVASQQIISPIIEGRIEVIKNPVKVEDKNQIKESYRLDQNYPNPFNPATTLSFVIGHQSFVTLKIYNILGEEVATIVNKELPEGNYKYQWDASGLASEVYIYQLKAGNFVNTKKLILMK